MKQEDKQQNYELAEKLISEQNFAAALIVGAVATLLAAAAYGIVVVGLARGNAISLLEVFRRAVSYVSFADVFFWFVAV